MTTSLSFVIPAKNEAGAIGAVVSKIFAAYAEAEIIVVDDGSNDDTGSIAKGAGATIVRHPYSKGNGAAIKSGARAAKGSVLVFMDGDGQHSVEDVSSMLDALVEDVDMVVGARSDKSQASFGRLAANKIYNKLASWVVGHTIPDLTSGMRAVRAEKFKEFLHLLPNGFSYPTTITMSFFRAGYSIKYHPIVAGVRDGESHINITRDGIRFLLIIFKVGTLYSPIKIFFPISSLLFASGALYYAYTFISAGRFTNMGLLLFVTSLIVFLMGLISEQITTLMFMQSNNESKKVR